MPLRHLALALAALLPTAMAVPAPLPESALDEVRFDAELNEIDALASMGMDDATFAEMADDEAEEEADLDAEEDDVDDEADDEAEEEAVDEEGGGSCGLLEAYQQAGGIERKYGYGATGNWVLSGCGGPMTAKDYVGVYIGGKIAALTGPGAKYMKPKPIPFGPYRGKVLAPYYAYSNQVRAPWKIYVCKGGKRYEAMVKSPMKQCTHFVKNAHCGNVVRPTKLQCTKTAGPHHGWGKKCDGKKDRQPHGVCKKFVKHCKGPWAGWMGKNCARSCCEVS